MRYVADEKQERSLKTVIDRWNHRHKVGAPVYYRKDDNSIIETKTRSAASILSGHTAIIWVEKVSGCVALDRVSPRTMPIPMVMVFQITPEIGLGQIKFNDVDDALGAVKTLLEDETCTGVRITKRLQVSDDS